MDNPQRQIDQLKVTLEYLELSLQDRTISQDYRDVLEKYRNNSLIRLSRIQEQVR